MYMGYRAYRTNPQPLHDFITGFQGTNNWNVTNKYQNLGRTTREIVDRLLN